MEEDRLSSLPRNLIELILAFLPLREAARTSVLSTLWSDKWEMRPSLVFDWSFHGDKWLVNVLKVLSSHRGPLAEFYISAPQPLRQIEYEIDPILRFLNRHQSCLESVCIFVSSCTISKRRFAWFANLKKLSLSSCILYPTARDVLSFEGFRVLSVVELRHVAICSGASSVKFRCPMLSHLTLYELGHNCFDTMGFLIEAPKLTFFHFVGKFASLWLKSTPQLKLVSISCTSTYFGGPESSTRFFGGLSMVESLTLSGSIYQYLARQSHNSITWSPLGKLKDLRMARLCLSNHDHVWCAVVMVKFCCHLQSLTIDMKLSVDEEVVDQSLAAGLRLVEELVINKYELKILERVEMRDVKGGCKVEMAFIRTLLAISPSLQHMELKFQSSAGEVTADSKVAFLSELVTFRRASTNATISVE